MVKMNRDEFMKEFDSILYYNRKEFNKKSMEEDAYRMGKEEVAKKFLYKNMTIEEVSEVTELPLKEIEKLKESLEQ